MLVYQIKQHPIGRQIAFFRNLTHYIRVIAVLKALIFKIIMIISNIKNRILLYAVWLVDLEIKAD